MSKGCRDCRPHRCCEPAEFKVNEARTTREGESVQIDPIMHALSVSKPSSFVVRFCK